MRLGGGPRWLTGSSAQGPKVAQFDVGANTPGRMIALADGSTVQMRRVLRLTERTITVDGTLLLLPEVVIDGWETTLTEPVEEVIALYADHGTHEQFHSEFKTDLDLERLPPSLKRSASGSKHFDRHPSDSARGCRQLNSTL